MIRVATTERLLERKGKGLKEKPKVGPLMLMTNDMIRNAMPNVKWITMSLNYLPKKDQDSKKMN